MPKYNHISNIPARVFFEIKKTKNYQLLKPKPKEQDLDVVYKSIDDDYFIQSDNPTANEYLRLQNSLVMNQYKIEILKQSLYFHYYNKTTKEMRDAFVKALKEGYGIEINENVPFREEVKRVLDLEIGGLSNEIALIEIEMNGMKSGGENEDFDFYDSIVQMGNLLQGNTLVKDDMTLATYVALRKNLEKQSMKK